MRILHAVHDYLPDQVAGVEVYTNRLSAGQAQRAASEPGSVGVLYAAMDSEQRTGDFESSVDASNGVVQLYRLIQNRDWTRFVQTWDDRRLRVAFDQILDEFRPDILHLQHLLYLGMPLIEAAQARQIRIVMTLHDQWWACAAGGQRFRRDRERCDVLDAESCARCTGSMVGPALAIRGRSQRRDSVERRRAPRTPHADSRETSLDADARKPGELRTRGHELLRDAWSSLASIGGEQRIEGRWSAMRELGERIDRFIAPSSEIAEAAVAFGFPEQKLIRVPHGIERSKGIQRPLPASLKCFGYLGSIVPHKGVHDLVSAFNALPDSLSLDIYGSLVDAPSYADELQALARHPGIRFLGQCAPEEVPQALDSIDCLVAPSIWRENAPLGIQEAFVSGRPVVATDLGGHPELLAGGGGLLYPPGDVSALTRAIERLASEPGLGQRLAETIPRIPSLVEHVDSIENIYRSLREEVSPRRAASRNAEGARADDMPRDVVFLDRDGVINFDSPDFVRCVDEWRPIPGSLEAIATLSKAGRRVFIVTNQSGVARGKMSREAVDSIHAEMEKAVERLGGRIDAVLVCPHGPDDGCACRKPRDGLLLQAEEILGVPISGAPFVGDRETDLLAARSAGCQPVFVRLSEAADVRLSPEWEDVPRFDRLAEALPMLLECTVAREPTKE